MNIILMKCEGGRDCAVAAIGTACQVDYRTAARALNHRDLPGPLESPLLSNPWNLYKALIAMGFWKKNITWAMLEQGKASPNETIVLVKNSFLDQHWIVWGGLEKHIVNGREIEYHKCYWGTSKEPILLDHRRMLEMFTTSMPNCAFQVYKANFWTLMWARIKSIFSFLDRG